MDRPTRQEQAQAILQRKAQRMASQILGRRAGGAADYEEAFNLEWVDIISEIPTATEMLALGRNVVGPRDGLYILDDGDTFRVYLQEKGIEFYALRGAGFEEARDAVIRRLIQIQGLPYLPPGAN
jgi:hypothetical protein